MCSRERSGGRPAFDPAVLLTLWISATLDAVGSARGLARLCEEHDAYRERPGAAECVNAIARNGGLQRFVVPGIPKRLGVLTRFALEHNVMRAVALVAPRYRFSLFDFLPRSEAGYVCPRARQKVN